MNLAGRPTFLRNPQYHSVDRLSPMPEGKVRLFVSPGFRISATSRGSFRSRAHLPGLAQLRRLLG